MGGNIAGDRQARKSVPARRLQRWCQCEALRQVLTEQVNALRDPRQMDESECFIEVTFGSAKGGGEEIDPTRRGRGVKIMMIVAGHDLPLAISEFTANPA